MRVACSPSPVKSAVNVFVPVPNVRSAEKPVEEREAPVTEIAGMFARSIERNAVIFAMIISPKKVNK